MKCRELFPYTVCQIKCMSDKMYANVYVFLLFCFKTWCCCVSINRSEYCLECKCPHRVLLWDPLYVVFLSSEFYHSYFVISSLNGSWFIYAGFILKLPIYGSPPDTICYEDSIYWEVGSTYQRDVENVLIMCLECLSKRVDNFWLCTPQDSYWWQLFPNNAIMCRLL